MTSNLASTLITKLTVSNNLDSADIRAIHGLPIRERKLGASALIVADGARSTDCCLLAEGFAFRAKTTFEGQRQVLSLHIPGEIPDLQSLHLHVMDHELVALTPCKVGFIAHEAIRDANQQRPNLAAALWRETLIDSAIFREWIVNVGRRSAAARMAHLLVEMHQRLKAVGLTQDDGFAFPITQAELGDCLGLSTVHVNRTLQSLRKDGLISVERAEFRILDMQGLEFLAGFDPTYLHLNPSI
ncbi:Crp/Fnr family transcriptional regulator [Bradyrhizobium jicamae]|uniref:Crp/Fnr family transcriptional regulator n=1 Tax=Bradyrhizobium jicamae TaxID=280332 RepID=UPI001BAB0F94|nr:Crp/Fnr family transcriptional regulator [Bradyrhizobium jicamae]MBR0755637.1 Crp/Fnr family transcriptional regulator [Bradyrhizobium jicamae]